MKTKSSDPYLELLFENRNKAYGAYELRTHYNKRLLKAFSYALLIGALFFIVPYLLTKIFTRNAAAVSIDKGMVYELKQFIIEPEHLQSVSQPVATRVIENNYRVVRTVPQEIIKPVENPVAVATSNAAASSTDNTSGTPASTTNSVPPDIIPSPAETIMNSATVDKAPSFPGGQSALMKYLNKNIHFTRQAVENNIAGKIYVSFIVNENGEIINVKLMNLLEASLDKEVLSAINKMPKWLPGMFHGAAVKTAFTLPVSFNLK